MTPAGYALLAAACAGWLATVVCWHREITRHAEAIDRVNAAHDGWRQALHGWRQANDHTIAALDVVHRLDPERAAYLAAQILRDDAQIAETPGQHPGGPTHQPVGDHTGSNPAS